MEKFMRRAMALAKKGMGYTNPNPMVGAVLVRNGEIIGEGFHEKFGGNHAEVNAIGSLKNLEDSTLYVTLEPCCHYNKTPPCTNLIIKSGLKHVVISCLDPNPLVAGKGVKTLRDAGIKVDIACLLKESEDMNRIFNHYILKKTPYVIMKYAMTLDGKISTLEGDSKWISNEESRKEVHKTRQEVMGIMVGINTVMQDNPKLTTRIENGKNALAIILDSKGRINLSSLVLDNPCIIAVTNMDSKKKKILENKGHKVMIVEADNNKINLKVLMIQLGKLGIDSILLEGGSILQGQMLKNSLVNEVHCYIAPKLVGSGLSPISGFDQSFMADALDLKNVSYKHFGSDVFIKGYLERRG